MSRRKQGKPQQRKTIDSLEDELDIIVCGDCQTNFPLHDIVKFIHHKVHKCNKENVEMVGEGSGSDRDDSDGTEEELSVISSRTPSITAPIGRKDSMEVQPRDAKMAATRLLEPMRERNSVDNIENNETIKEVEDVKKERVPPEPDKPHIKPKHVDAESNTTNSEPSKFLCGTCKHTFNSAWFLVQHAQSAHGMKIYIQQPQITPSVSRDATPKTPQASVSASPPPQIHGNANTSPQHPFMFPIRSGFHDVSQGCSPVGPFSRPPGPANMRLDFMPTDPFPRFGIPPFDPHHHSHPFHSPFVERPRLPLSIGYDDYYSQRLRELVTSTTPSPSKKPQQSFSPADSPFSVGRSADSTPPEDVSQKSGGRSTPDKLKSCEFCGKRFRFQSNLIVHRRSHTGEKPFKCSLCPHACTQASKLKRHMKTHTSNNKSPVSGMSHTSNTSIHSDGSIGSSRSTPDSNKKGEYGEDMEDEMEESEEEEEEELEGMEGVEDTERNEQHNVDECRSETDSNENTGKQSLERPTRTNLSPNNRVMDFSLSLARENQSLLRDVMSRSGLSAIREFSEAFQQALEENSFKDGKSSADREVSQNGIKEEHPTLARAVSPSRSARDLDDHQISLVKREPSERISQAVESLYAPANMWYPAVSHHRGFYLGHPSMPLPDRETNHNSFLPKPHPESALKSVHGIPTPGTSNSAQNGATPLRRNDKRNDTCEFCGKIFKNCSNLTVHRRSHTGEKPYKCELCSYACAQSSKLTRHMKTHGRQGKDVYRCKFCGMPFSVASTLEKHMRKCMENHSGVRGIPEPDTDTNSTTASNLEPNFNCDKMEQR